MQLAEFIDTHVPALERDEVRHNLILGVLARAAHDPSLPLLTWTLGGPGACAIKTPGRPIILGEVDRGQCRALAEATLAMGSEGVVGVDVAPRWFVERAVELGQTFRDPIPQRIHALREKPTYPDARGGARLVRLQDAPRFVDHLLIPVVCFGIIRSGGSRRDYRLRNGRDIGRNSRRQRRRDKYSNFLTV